LVTKAAPKGSHLRKTGVRFKSLTLSIYFRCSHEATFAAMSTTSGAVDRRLVSQPRVESSVVQAGLRTLSSYAINPALLVLDLRENQAERHQALQSRRNQRP
jgi:hypothetical protein